MKKLLVFFVLFLPMLACAQFVRQDQPSALTKTSVDLGIGFGLDYGGIGGRLSVFPEKHIGVFGSVGYALIGAGYNLGAKFRANPDHRVCFSFGAMYGYNAVIQVSGASQYNKTYMGPSISGGLEFRSGRNPKNYSNIELVIPFRSTEFAHDLSALKANPAIRISNPLPFAISFGYHFGF